MRFSSCSCSFWSRCSSLRICASSRSTCLSVLGFCSDFSSQHASSADSSQHSLLLLLLLLADSLPDFSRPELSLPLDPDSLPELPLAEPLPEPDPDSLPDREPLADPLSEPLLDALPEPLVEPLPELLPELLPFGLALAEPLADELPEDASCSDEPLAEALLADELLAEERLSDELLSWAGSVMDRVSVRTAVSSRFMVVASGCGFDAMVAMWQHPALVVRRNGVRPVGRSGAR